MKKTNLVAISALVALSTVGCQFYARSAEDYSQATKDVLKTKKDEIRSCYNDVLDGNPDASGVVAVDFVVQAKTGEITDVEVDQESTTAPEPLQNCLVTAMDGLVLDPPDAREGAASFSFEFKPQG